MSSTNLSRNMPYQDWGFDIKKNKRRKKTLPITYILVIMCLWGDEKQFFISM